jgi:spermidine synthase
MQAYEIHPGSLRSLYGTLAAELPAVETWQTLPGDLMLVASRAPLRHDLARIGEKDPRGAVPGRPARRVAHRLASRASSPASSRGPAFTERLRALGDPLNTDDRNTLEFGFARSLGVSGLLDVEAVRAAAAEAGGDHPRSREARSTSRAILDERLGVHSSAGEAPPGPGAAAGDLGGGPTRTRCGRAARARPPCRPGASQDREPEGPNELALVAEVTADAGDERALPLVEALRAYQPAEADACLGRLLLRLGSHEAALAALESAFAAYRRSPWPSPLVMQGALDAALELAGQRPDLAPRVLASLEEPFALGMLNELRVEEAFLVGSLRPPGADCARLLAPVEPHVPFTRAWLEYRLQCFSATDDARLVSAFDDLRRFEARAPEALLPAGE